MKCFISLNLKNCYKLLESVGPGLRSDGSACNETGRAAGFDSHIYVNELQLLDISAVE